MPMPPLGCLLFEAARLLWFWYPAFSVALNGNISLCQRRTNVRSITRTTSGGRCSVGRLSPAHIPRYIDRLCAFPTSCVLPPALCVHVLEDRTGCVGTWQVWGVKFQVHVLHQGGVGKRCMCLCAFGDVVCCFSIYMTQYRFSCVRIPGLIKLHKWAKLVKSALHEHKPITLT